MRRIEEIHKRNERTDELYSGAGAVHALQDRAFLLDLARRMHDAASALVRHDKLADKRDHIGNCSELQALEDILEESK